MLCDVHPNYIYKDAQAHMHKYFLASMMVSLLLFLSVQLRGHDAAVLVDDLANHAFTI